ncbi:hypothetical protein HZI73_26410 (plasmid) [Vallitalea pronyensis]|uniref:Uncharacterized protein n=1 Tax=Vallitalea pronyensis TaxID=1348613 RepID=A0A8J8SJW4_9FIRM|nr:hypothetical protein [Vallitalea pronyensis]QUI25949.1 hypothetical protein HZI73_26410 [Vallitalea pronyensis]
MDKIYEGLIQDIHAFQQKTLEIVREDQYLGLVKKWEKNIIHQDFYQRNTSFHGKIWCLDEFDHKRCTFHIYKMMYVKESKTIYQEKHVINKKEMDAIVKFDKIFKKAGSLHKALDILHNNSKNNEDNEGNVVELQNRM